jgi:hypothetical protein
VRSGGPRGYCPSNLADDVPPAAQQSRGGGAAEGRGRGRGHNTGARSGRVEGFQRRVEHRKVRYREAVHTTTPTRRRCGGGVDPRRHHVSTWQCKHVQPSQCQCQCKHSYRRSPGDQMTTNATYSKMLKDCTPYPLSVPDTHSAHRPDAASRALTTKQLIRNYPRYLVKCCNVT